MRNRIIRAENYKIRRNLTVRIAILVVVCAVIAGCALFYGAMHIISGELIEAAGGYATDKERLTILIYLTAGVLYCHLHSCC